MNPDHYTADQAYDLGFDEGYRAADYQPTCILPRLIPEGCEGTAVAYKIGFTDGFLARKADLTEASKE